MFPQLLSLATKAATVLLALSSTVSATPVIPHNATLARRDGTFTNPIVPGGGADPWILDFQGHYYLVLMAGDSITVRKSDNLARFDVPPVTVFNPPAGFHEVWAPEMHEINGELYIYVAMDHGDNSQHRMYVLKGSSNTNPQAPFNFVGQLTTPDNNWAIDGTVLKYQNGQNYFIWSGWTDSGNVSNQQLYIAKMSSPTSLTGNRVLLHEPNLSWQRSGASGVNEGPEILTHNGRTFLVYSTAGSWTRDYNLGLMGIDNGADPMNPRNWWRKDTNPVFQQSNVAFGTGHASFTYDRAGVPWIVYHAMDKPDGGWNGRSVRAQPFQWNTDGSPWFPIPVALGTPLPAPA